MTEFELIETMLMAQAGLDKAGMNFVSVVFAFVVAAHFVGNKLPPTPTGGLSVIYSLWLIGPTIAITSHLDLLVRTAAEYMRLFPEGYIPPVPSYITTTMVIIFAPYAIGWIGSLIYMHFYIRKNYVGASRNDT